MNARFFSWEEAVSWLMAQADKQELVKDCYYDESVHEAAERYWQSDEWKAITALIGRNPAFALDLGAGRGIASYALAKNGWNVLAVEPDPSMLVGAGAIQELADKHKLPIKILKEFGEQINCDSDAFDLVFARQVLHHAKNLNQLCAEVYRALKPGGVFVAVRDHVISSKEDLPAFFDVHPLHHLYGGENAYTKQEYLTAMQHAGFKVLRVIRSFDSVINYAPYSMSTLKLETKSRLSRIPVLGRLSIFLDSPIIFKFLLRILSVIDRRPGRLYSFVCIKPKEH